MDRIKSSSFIVTVCLLCAVVSASSNLGKAHSLLGMQPEATVEA